MSEPIHKIQASFSGGEFASSLWARVDIQKYASGARKLLNFLVHPHGGISNRPGLYKVAAAKHNNSKIRVIDFQFASDENYVIELGADSTAPNAGYARFCYNDAQLTSGGTIVEVATPYLEADLPYVRYVQSADTMFIVHPDYAPRELQRLSASSWQLTAYDFQNGPFQLPNDDTTHTMYVMATSGNTTIVSSANFFFAGHAGGLMELTHSIEGQAVTTAFGSATTGSSISCGGTWRVITHGTWAGKLRIEKSTDGGSTWTCLRQFSSASDFNVDTYGSEDMSDGALPFLVRANMTVYVSGTCNVDLDSDPYIATGVFSMKTYISATQMSGTLQRATGSTAVTSNWAEGAWSDYRGWPQEVTFSQDRLVFANTYYQPQTLWASQTGNYYSFFVNSPLVDSDGISLNLPSQKLNEINGLTSLLKLLVFSSGAEWSVGGDASGVFAPATISTRMNSMTGSSGVQPVVIVNRAIYVQSRGCVVRDLGYDLFTDTFTGANLSILSNHLFFNYNIVEMAYQQDPDSLVWAVRDDGKLLSMTYMREQEVLAWTQHDTYGGVDKFESVTCIPASGYNEVWFSVNRGGQRYIERMVQRMTSEDREDQFFVDSGVTYDSSTTPDATIKLLMHCDGSNAGITFTEENGKAVTNAATFDAYTVVCSHFDGVDGAVAYTDPVAGAYTFQGTAQLSTAQYKFTPTSLLLNGTTDYATLPNSANYNFAAGDFTIEGWVNFNSITALQNIIAHRQDGNNEWQIYKDTHANGDKLNIYFFTGGVMKAQYVMTNAWAGLATLAWHHLAFVRNGTSLKIYIDGVSQPLTATVAIGSTDVGAVTGLLYVGQSGSSGGYYNGWIDELRISKGVARFTADFTPPIYPYSQVVTSTTTPKFGTASAYFDGSTSLSLADSADWDIGVKSTVDFWVSFRDLTTQQIMISQRQNDTNVWEMYKLSNASGNKLGFYAIVGGVGKADYVMTNSWSPTINTWYHIALVLNTTTVKLFINGVSQALTENQALASISGIAGSLYLGQYGDGSNYIVGSMDEVRLSKGVARWTVDFTPPTSAYTLYGNPVTSISGLDHLEGRLVSILADGNVCTPQTVTSGTVSFTNSASLVHAGLGYNADLETLNIELGLPDGTLQGRKVQVSRVVLRMDKSRGGYLGPDFTHLYEVLGDYKTSVSTSLFTGDIKQVLGGGYSDGGRFCFRQSDPLPVTILAVLPLASPGQTTGL